MSEVYNPKRSSHVPRHASRLQSKRARTLRFTGPAVPITARVHSTPQTCRWRTPNTYGGKAAIGWASDRSGTVASGC
eukprot:3294613-Pyramimonas_sp.AAC.1